MWVQMLILPLTYLCDLQKKLNFSVSIFPFPSRDNPSLVRPVMSREKRVKFMNLHRVAMASHVIIHT